MSEYNKDYFGNYGSKLQELLKDILINPEVNIYDYACTLNSKLKSVESDTDFKNLNIVLFYKGNTLTMDAKDEIKYKDGKGDVNKSSYWGKFSYMFNSGISSEKQLSESVKVKSKVKELFNHILEFSKKYALGADYALPENYKF